jgi:hypothetical protein
MGKRYGGCSILWPFCVFGFITAVVVEGTYVRDSRGLGLCMVGTVGYSAAGECVAGSGSMVDSLGKGRRGKRRQGRWGESG